MNWLQAVQAALRLIEAITPIVAELGRSGHDPVDPTLLDAEHAAALQAMQEAFRTLPRDGV